MAYRIAKIPRREWSPSFKTARMRMCESSSAPSLLLSIIGREMVGILGEPGVGVEKNTRPRFQQIRSGTKLVPLQDPGL